MTKDELLKMHGSYLEVETNIGDIEEWILAKRDLPYSPEIRPEAIQIYQIMLLKDIAKKLGEHQ